MTRVSVEPTRRRVSLFPLPRARDVPCTGGSTTPAGRDRRRAPGRGGRGRGRGRGPLPRAAAPRPRGPRPSPGQPPFVLDLGSRYHGRRDGEAAAGGAGRARATTARDGLLALAVASARIDARRRRRRPGGPERGRGEARLGRRARPGRAGAPVLRPAGDRGGRCSSCRTCQADPKDPFPRFEEGLVLLFAGPPAGRRGPKLRAARSAAPDSTYALRADNALHPGMRIGYPLWVPTHSLAQGSTAVLVGGGPPRARLAAGPAGAGRRAAAARPADARPGRALGRRWRPIPAKHRRPGRARSCWRFSKDAAAGGLRRARAT